jgi:tRNA(Ile)-lysidine synthase
LQQPGDALFLGHHLDDQLETLLLRLFRSSGVAGLAAMAEQSHQQPLRVRPLLGVSRAELRSHAQQRDLSWVEDGSNSDERFSRNFIRHRLLPVIAEHWPDYRSRLAALSRSARDSSELLDEVAAQDLAAVASRDRWGQFLDLASLAGYSPPRIKNMLRAWLHQLGQPALRQRQWAAFCSGLMAACDQANPVVALVRGSLRRYRNRVYWVPENPDVAMAPLPAWNARRTLDLGAAGKLLVAPVTGVGLDRQHCYQPAFRRGGEKVRGAGWRHSKTLGQYLHEQGVPPWWRHRVPLLFFAEELAAVADFCVCEGFVAAPGVAAIRLHWHTGKLPLGGV